MNVAFELRRRPEGRHAIALLFPGSDVAALLGLCGRLGLDPSGRTFAVAGGFLLKLDEPTPRPIPGAIRLRALAEDLFLPADAELVPTLLDDEAEGLARNRGLVFLPGGRILGFDPRVPLDPSALLVAGARPRRDWGPLPRPEPLAERIEEIIVDCPSDSPEDVLGSGDVAIGTEEPRPVVSDPASTLLGKAALGAGKGMVRLGQMLGFKGLAGLGAGWIGRAVALAPRLSEDLIGRQAAALRELLREFREGDPDRALRRALPLGVPGGTRGADAYAGDHLPPRDLSYALKDFLGPQQPGGIWLGGQDVMAELTREYRKAAEQALRQGDYRRAAMIYGKLLRDYHAAAQALSRGGLHHDAAILLLAKLDDRAAAARAFEAAGEVDRAVQLYRQVGDHEAAGHLLRRIGEEEAALAEYRIAADQLIRAGAGHLAAGDLMLKKAGRADLAMDLFAAGWARRPEVNAVPCALRMARLLAEARDPEPLLALLDQADAFLGPPGNDHAAGEFYNEVARLAGTEGLGPARDELRDRALRGLAVKLRQQSQSGARGVALVSTLLARPGLWPSAVVNDADFAVKAATRRPGDEPRPEPSQAVARRSRVGVGVVTAAVAAVRSDEFFLGFEGGEVYCYRPEWAEVVRVAADGHPVVSLAVDPEGLTVVILRAVGAGFGALSTYARHPDGSYRLLTGTALEGVSGPWLTPVLAGSGEEKVGLWDGRDLVIFHVASLETRGRLEVGSQESPPEAALLVSWSEDEDPGAILHRHREWCFVRQGAMKAGRRGSGLAWRPGLSPASRLRSVLVSWAWSDPEHLEVAGLGDSGSLHWAAFHVVDGDLDLVASNVATDETGYLAATLVRPGVVAGVTRSRVDWFRSGASRFTLRTRNHQAIPSAVACFPSGRTGELIVVCGDGFISRVPIPC
ncbi:MAG: tetratricopeptide repeat protein [Planctomycetaceae bacterium]|nr:tetratricopeptide repeat protein [Planctomycetaceae bacterium]